MSRELPRIIQEIGFVDHNLDEDAVMALHLPNEIVDRAVLDWHLDIPLQDTVRGSSDNVTPNDLLRHPTKNSPEYALVLSGTLPEIINITNADNHWTILETEGLLRLMRAVVMRQKIVNVRKIPLGLVPAVTKERYEA